MTTAPIVVARGITKRYDAVVALDGAQIDLYPGEVNALLGDNGAGKSTLMKVLSGFVTPDHGVITVEGHRLHTQTLSGAMHQGIETVYQDLSLVDTMTAIQNVFLGRELLRQNWWGKALRIADDGTMAAETQRAVDEIGARIPSIRQPVAAMSGGQRQALAIARAMLWGQRVVMLDEPTAALGVNESAHVLEIIQGLRDRGVAVLLISHNIEHVWHVADRVTVLRHGSTVGESHITNTTVDEVIAMITGGSAVASAVDSSKTRERLGG